MSIVICKILARVKKSLLSQWIYKFYLDALFGTLSRRDDRNKIFFKRSAGVTFSLDGKTNEKDQGGCNLNELSFHFFKLIYLAVLAP